VSANADKDANAPSGGGAGWRRNKPVSDETAAPSGQAAPVPSAAPRSGDDVPAKPAGLDATFVSDSKIARGTAAAGGREVGGVSDGTIVQPGQMPTSPIDEASRGPEPVGDRTMITAARATPAAMPAASASHDVPEIQGIEIVREIARGGMGVVFEGHQAFLDRRVAVKLLLSEGQGSDFTKRFRREAKILASLSHPNVVACYQADVAPDGRCFLVMEYIDGPTLAGYVEKKGPLAPRDALRVCRATASALAYAHQSGIIHRDVKPANVLLKTPQHGKPGDTFPFEPMLADLGLARASGDAAPKVTVEGLTMQGQVMGSPPTMAPEQFDAPDSVDFRTDVYGLGCVLFHCLTGRLAFPQTTLTKLIAVKSQSPPPDPRELAKSVPPDVAQLVRDMLAPKPEDRPASYDALLARIDALLEAKTAKRAASNKGPLIALAVLLLGALGWGAKEMLGAASTPPKDDGANGGMDVAVEGDGASNENGATNGDASNANGTNGTNEAGGSDANAQSSNTDVDDDPTPVVVEPVEAPPVEQEPVGPRLEAIATGESRTFFGAPDAAIANWTVRTGPASCWGENPDLSTNGTMGESGLDVAHTSIEHALPAPAWTLEGFVELTSPRRRATKEAALVLVTSNGSGIEIAQRIEGTNVVFAAGVAAPDADGCFRAATPIAELAPAAGATADYQALAVRIDWDGKRLALTLAGVEDPMRVDEPLLADGRIVATWESSDLAALGLGVPVALCVELEQGSAKLGRFVVTGR
jgi:serine/threonine-protein kinase